MNNFTARLPLIENRELRGYMLELDAFIKASNIIKVNMEVIEVVKTGQASLANGNFLISVQGENLLIQKRIDGEWVTQSTI